MDHLSESPIMHPRKLCRRICAAEKAIAELQLEHQSIAARDMFAFVQSTRIFSKNGPARRFKVHELFAWVITSDLVVGKTRISFVQ